MKKKTDGRGGRREGAGRKPESNEGNRVVLHCKVLPSTLAKIKKSGAQLGSDGKAVDEAFA